MSFAAALEQQRKVGIPGPPCAIAVILGSMDDGDAATLRDALARPKDDVPHVQIARALTVEGYSVNGRPVKGHHVAHHRNNCACERAA